MSHDAFFGQKINEYEYSDSWTSTKKVNYQKPPSDYKSIDLHI